MAQAPAMPLFTDALLGDTQHLSLEEFGAYVKLLIIDWRQKPANLSNDDSRLARMLGISVRRWKSMKSTIVDGKLYRISGQSLRQKRLDKEFAYVQKKSIQNRTNAMRAVKAKVLKSGNTGPANGSPNGSAKRKRTVQRNDSERLTTHTHNQQVSNQTPRVSSEPRATVLAADAEGEVRRLLSDSDSRWETRNCSLVRMWIHEGADPETHILPVIREEIAKGAASRVSTLRYFTPAIERRRDSKPVPGPDPAAGSDRAAASELAKTLSDEEFAVKLAVTFANEGAEAADELGRDYLERQSGPKAKEA